MKTRLILSALLLIPCLAYGQQQSDLKSLLSSRGKILYGDEPNSLVVIDYQDNIDNIAEYLETVDVPPQQVFIDARVVEVALTHENTLGINWSAFKSTTDGPGLNLERSLSIHGQNTIGGALASGVPTALTQNLAQLPVYNPPGQSLVGQLTPFTFTIFNRNLEVVLQTLASTLDADVLSAPRITTVNNRPAVIQVTERLPWAEPTVTTTDTGSTVTWNVKFEDVGIVLKATPMINSEGRISLILDPEVSEKVSDFKLTIPNGNDAIDYYVPVIDRRTASTKVVIGNGQTLIIGGLIKNRNTTQEIKIPFFGDIPVLGHLFKSTRKSKVKSELLIFVSPTIVNESQIVKMEQEAQYGAGKPAYDEMQKHSQFMKRHQKKDDDRKETLRKTLRSLSKQQEQLVGERIRLQEALTKEENSLQQLQAQPVK